LLYDLQHRIEAQHCFTAEEVRRFADAYYDSKGSQYKLHAILQPAVDRYDGMSDPDKERFRGCVRQFVELYGFLSQILTFTDPELHKVFLFLRFLVRKLILKRGELPLEVLNQVDMDSLAVQPREKAPIKLTAGKGQLEPPRLGEPLPPVPGAVEELSKIIRDLNERFGAKLTDDDKVFIQRLEDSLASNATLADSLRVNSEENARLTFDHVVDDRVQEMIDTNFKFYKLITDNPAFARNFKDFLFDRLRRGAGTPGAAP
jgi:type I restriction enzyme R subunit